MAPTRPEPRKDPATASSSDEEEVGPSEEEDDEEEEEVREEEEDSSEEEDDSSEEEADGDEEHGGSSPVSRKNPVANKLKSADAVPDAVAAPTAVPTRRASDSDAGSEAETDSDSETERRDRIPKRESAAKNVVVKVTEENRDSKKTKSSDAAKSTAKRQSKAERSSKDVKRSKKDPEGKPGTRPVGEDEKKPGDDAKKQYFQRLWSEHDEILLLEGMIDFKSDRGVSPYDDMSGFYEFVKKSISFDVSKVQFVDKIRSLKKKYANNLARGKNGGDLSFARAHDRKAFKLSMNIWGADGAVVEWALKSNGKSKKKNQSGKMKQQLFSNGQRMEIDGVEITSAGMNRTDGFAMIPIERTMAAFGVDERTVKEGWSMVALEDKKKLEEQWKALRLVEIEFLVKKSQIVNEAARMIAETLRASH